MTRIGKFISLTLAVMALLSPAALAQNENPFRGGGGSKTGLEHGTLLGSPKDAPLKPITNDRYKDNRLKDLESKMDERDWSSEDTAWDQASAAGTVEALQKYIVRFPGGAHIAQANSMLTDAKVRDILNSAHNPIPGLKRTKPDDDSLTSTIEVTNETGCMLTFMYSGQQSKTVTILPGGKGSVELPNGEYKIAASVDRQGVRPFGGLGTVLGGTYEVSFYIVSAAYEQDPGPGWIRRF